MVTDAQTALARTSGIAFKDGIQVTAEGATVVLRGTVSDEADWRAAEYALRFTPGIREVRNELVVSPRRPGTVRGP